MSTGPNAGRRGRPWRRLRLQILERDAYTCRIRGPRCTVDATHVDHIQPRITHPHLAEDPANLRAACRSCNLDKADAPGRAPAEATRAW